MGKKDNILNRIPLTVRPSTRKRLKKAVEVQKSMDRIEFQIDQLQGLAGGGHPLPEWQDHYGDRVILLTRAQEDLRIKFAKMVDEVLEKDEKFGKDFIDNKAITARFGIKRENREAKRREAEADVIQELEETKGGDKVIGSFKERLRRNKKKPKPEAQGVQPSLRL